MNNTFLIIGGTGKTGRRVAERLSNKNLDVRIGSRSAEVPFDWNDPTGWDAALQGVKAVYITYQPDLAVPGAFEDVTLLVEKAKQAGVQKLVILSGKGEEEAQRCEQVVLNSGIGATVVRASWFNQNYSESFFLEPLQAGHLALPKADAKVPYIDADDIADVVVEALLHDKHNGHIYELTGPHRLTFPEVTEEVAKATGREIQFQEISMDQYKAGMREQQVPEEMIGLLAYLFEVTLLESNSEVTNDVEKVLGRKPKDFSTYAEETAASGVWNIEVGIE